MEAHTIENGFFHAAKPIWPAGRESDKNITVGFRGAVAKAGDERFVLRLAASTYTGST